MERNYWQEYWDNYYKFMAMYLGEVQDAYPDADMKKEYVEVARLFEPPMSPEGFGNNNSEENNNNMMDNNNNMDDNMMDNNMDDNMLNNNNNMDDNMLNNNNNMDNYLEEDNNQPNILPNGETFNETYMSPGNTTSESSNGQVFAQPILFPGSGTTPGQFISPGGGQFTINNCRRMAIVRIQMRRGFNPSNFFMAVDRSDRRSIQGFRIACEGNRIRFVPMAVEYRNINVIECAF